MFRAIREQFSGFGDRLGATWQNLHQRKVLRLFLFEFVVVLLGVLAAQGLQSWAAEREAAERADGAIAVYDRELAQGLQTALIWQASAGCLRDQVTRIMRTAADVGHIDSDLAANPGLWLTPITPLGEEAKLRFRSQRSDEVLDTVTLDTAHLNRIWDRADQLSREWRQFSRLDPSYGLVRESDIAAARETGANILSYLASIEGSATNVINELTELGYEPRSSFEIGQNVRPIANCAEMEAAKAIYVIEDVAPTLPDS